MLQLRKFGTLLVLARLLHFWQVS